MNKEVTVDKNLCTGCGKCIKICPQKILYIDKVDKICKVNNEKKCDKLKGCEQICPTGAIDVRHFTDKQIEAQLEAILEE